MNKDEKAAVVEEVAGQIQEAEAVFAVDYRGLSVPQAADLRAQLQEADATFRIVKNRLTKLSVDKAGAEGLKEYLEGPTAFTFVNGDAALAAKAIARFTKEFDVLEFKGGLMGGEALTADQLRDISKLPARDVLYGQFAGIVASPLTTLVRGLGSMVSGLAVALGQIAEQGLVGGDAPAEEAPAQAEAPAEEEPAAEAEAPAEEEPAAEAEEPAAEEAPAEEEPAAEAEEAPAEEEPAEEEAPAEEEPAAEAEPAPEAEAADETSGDAAEAAPEETETDNKEDQ
jgi:large subunit ribosomal protein L10